MQTPEAFWTDLEQRSKTLNRIVELPIRYVADPEDSAPASIVVTPEGPRVQLSAASRDLLLAIKPEEIAARLADPADGASWRATYNDVVGSQRLLSLNEA